MNYTIHRDRIFLNLMIWSKKNLNVNKAGIVKVSFLLLLIFKKYI
jgi:hypothetical protein